MKRLLFLTLAALQIALPAEVSPSGLDPQLLARIPARMQSFVDAGRASGIVTLVMRHGHLGALNAVGYRDLESKAPMRTTDIFRIMSMSKPVTSAAVMILVDEGKVGIYDPVEKFIPEFKGKAVTVFHLLTHSSGIAMPSSAKPQTLEEAGVVIGKAPLKFDPGTKWAYSTDGMNLVGRIVEVASGQTFEKFVATRIFTPLGMKDSSWAPVPEKAGRIATVYMLDASDKLVIPKPRDLGVQPSPGAGMLSTATDMGRFYQMTLNKGTLNGRRILSPAAVELMTGVHTGDLIVGFAPGMGYGFGWGVIKDFKGAWRYCSVGSYGHGGAYRTYGWVDPKLDMVRVLMLQRTNGGGDTAEEINAFLAMAAASIK